MKKRKSDQISKNKAKNISSHTSEEIKKVFSGTHIDSEPESDDDSEDNIPNYYIDNLFKDIGEC